MRAIRSLTAATLLARSVLLVMPAQAQIARSTVGPLTGVDGKTPKGADSTGIALYAAPFLGPAGSVGGVTPTATAGSQYVSLNFTVSATTLPTPRGPSYEPGGNLRRLHAHITLAPLDANQQPLVDGGGLAVLATFPDTILLRTPPADSGSTHIGTAAFNTLTRQFLPQIEASRQLGQRAGAELATFLHLYHRPSAQVQVGYLSGQREFGWIWYGRDPFVIDGTHHTSAALGMAPAVRFIRVRLRVTAEWQSHGHWVRDSEFVLALGSATP